MASRMQTNNGTACTTCNSSPNSSNCTATASSPLVLHHPPLYYVQSPRDSSASTHDEVDKFSERRSTPYSSAPSSPLINLFYHTALGEPLPKNNVLNHSNYHHHSHNNINLANQCRRLPPLPPANHAGLKKAPYKWATVDEESESPPDHIYDYGGGGGNRKLFMFWCRVYLIALFIMLLVAFLVLWIACRPRGSQMAVRRIEFLDLALIHGSDRTQVPTDMLFLKSRVKLTFHNPSKYFRLAFQPTVLTLSYMGVPIAHGKVIPLDLSQESTRYIEVEMDSQEAPLYGAGLNFELSSNEISAQLKTSVDMQVIILWNVLKRRFLQDLNCNFIVNTTTLKVFHMTCN